MVLQFRKDLKSLVPHGTCRFDSGPPHHSIQVRYPLDRFKDWTGGIPDWLHFLPSGRGGIGRRTGLNRNLSARRETGDAELLKLGGTFEMAIRVVIPRPSMEHPADVL